MVDVITKISIAASAEKVAAYAADPDNAPKWYKNIKSVEWKTPKPLSVGTQIAFKAKFLGKELAYIYKIEDYIPVHILIMSTSEGPFPMKTIYEWQTIDEHSCIMTLRNTGKPSGYSQFLSPFIKLAMKNANKKDLMLLKSILEKS